jgi:hypothetical protein
MADHSIIVLGKRRPPKVVPPILLGDQGQTVWFEARGTAVQIKFWRWPFEPPERLIRVDAGGISGPYTLRDWEKDVDEYLYSVFCSETGELAIGGSEPGIIIRRPSGSGE